MTAELKDFWLSAVQKVGFPIVAASACLYAFWTIGNKVADGHVQYLRQQVEIGNQNVKSMQGIKDAVTIQATEMTTTRKTVEAQSDQIREIAKELREFRIEATSGK
jgi:hypothetical protein